MTELVPLRRTTRSGNPRILSKDQISAVGSESVHATDRACKSALRKRTCRLWTPDCPQCWQGLHRTEINGRILGWHRLKIEFVDLWCIATFPRTPNVITTTDPDQPSTETISCVNAVNMRWIDRFMIRTNSSVQVMFVFPYKFAMVFPYQVTYSSHHGTSDLVV